MWNPEFSKKHHKLPGSFLSIENCENCTQFPKVWRKFLFTRIKIFHFFLFTNDSRVCKIESLFSSIFHASENSLLKSMSVANIFTFSHCSLFHRHACCVKLTLKISERKPVKFYWKQFFISFDVFYYHPRSEWESCWKLKENLRHLEAVNSSLLKFSWIESWSR